jgi:uncharacterized protein YwqG
MNFFEKILRLFKLDNQEKMESNVDINKDVLNEQSPVSLKEIEELVLPILRKATKIEVQNPVTPPSDSQLLSHFGGQPYFEEGGKWFKSESGRYMEFIFQIFNSDELVLPKSIKLVQFFYDLEEFPWDTKDDGWYIKIYETLNVNKLKKIPKPVELEESKYCEMAFKSVESLPDWEGIHLYENRTVKIACALNDDEPWEAYDKVVEKLIGEQDYQSQLGGYPRWVQGESTPKNSNGDYMKLLFQIDSEDNAGLMWGDVGLVYAFYDEETKRIEFSLQCH